MFSKKIICLLFFILSFFSTTSAQTNPIDTSGNNFCTAWDKIVRSSTGNFESIKGTPLKEIGDNPKSNEVLYFNSIVKLPGGASSIRRNRNDTIGFFFECVYNDFYMGDSIKVVQLFDSLKSVIYTCMNTGPCDSCTKRDYMKPNLRQEKVYYEELFFYKVASDYDQGLKNSYVRISCQADAFGGLIFIYFYHQK